MWRRQHFWCSPLTFQAFTAFPAFLFPRKWLFHKAPGFPGSTPPQQALGASLGAYLGLDSVRGQQDRGFGGTEDLLIQNLLLHLHTEQQRTDNTRLVEHSRA